MDLTNVLLLRCWLFDMWGRACDEYNFLETKKIAKCLVVQFDAIKKVEPPLYAAGAEVTIQDE